MKTIKLQEWNGSRKIKVEIDETQGTPVTWAEGSVSYRIQGRDRSFIRIHKGGEIATILSNKIGGKILTKVYLILS